MRRAAPCVILLAIVASVTGTAQAGPEAPLRVQAVHAMKKAGTFFRDYVATRGGYVYFYSMDLKQRWGEGIATPTQVWVQPPGTPTVGMAFIAAYRATGDRLYLDAATDAALALAHGQLKSGGWTNCIDFDPHGSRSADYLNGKGRGKNNSSLDDGQTQSAIRLLMHVDQAHGFKHAQIRASLGVALRALFAAQFPNGAFPQVWTGPVQPHPVIKAGFPDYDWRTDGRIKNYWDMYTLNDNVCGYVADTLIDGYRIYKKQSLLNALRKLGDFLVLAQLPQPQRGWAQQYNYEMKPIWARRFEPAAVAGDETQEAIATLIRISEVTGDKRYLAPIPDALAYLKKSMLPDGRLARYYELKTNRPLYMQRNGKQYTLTYDDSKLPSHYAWKIDSRIQELEQLFQNARNNIRPKESVPSEDEVRTIMRSLNGNGRWVSTFDGRPLVGQAKMPIGTKYIASELFSENLEKLSAFIHASR